MQVHSRSNGGSTHASTAIAMLAVLAAAMGFSCQADEADEAKQTGVASEQAATAQAAQPQDEPKYLTMGSVRLGEVWPGPEKKLYSQGNEELIIREVLQDQRNGTFLDVGCSTPIENNTTYYLEKHLGWTGISIDALPEHASAYAENRPNSKFFSYIVTDHSGGTETFYRVPGATGLSSTDKDRKMIKDLKKEKLELPTITLDDLLEQNGVNSIDFMSMDIEGGAAKALSSFDIDKYHPKLICIEAPGLEEFIEKYMTDHHYVRLEKYRRYDHVNWYYVPVDDTAKGAS